MLQLVSSVPDWPEDFTTSQTVWEHKDEKKEIQQGKNLVDAAKKAGVKHFVWSTLDRKTDPYVPHFGSKAAVDDYLKESGVPHTS